MPQENTFTITGGPLKPHEYIVIKREMNAADEAWITNHSAQLSGDKKNPQVNLTIGDVKLATLKRMITSWSLTEDGPIIDGKAQQVPIILSEKAIEELPRRYSAYVNKVIDRLNPDDEDDDAAFLLGADAGSVTSSSRAK